MAFSQVQVQDGYLIRVACQAGEALEKAARFHYDKVNRGKI